MKTYARYTELSTHEVLEHLDCSAEKLAKLEQQGEYFAVLKPGNPHDKRYPAFQFSLPNRPFLKKLISEYRRAGVSTNMLWNFLRKISKDLGGKTLLDVLHGESSPALIGLDEAERIDVILDLALEELSRVGR